MKKVLLILLAFGILLGAFACSKDTTTTPDVTTTGEQEPLDQDSLLDSISNAIKAAFD